jgi:hypothetical protein
VAQVDDLGTHALQDSPHDVDGGVMPVKQTGCGDEAHFVGGFVGSKRLVFSGQIGHGVEAVCTVEIQQRNRLLTGKPKILIDVTSIIA